MTTRAKLLSLAAVFACAWLVFALRHEEPPHALPEPEAVAAAVAQPEVRAYLQRHGATSHRVGPLFDGQERVSFFRGGRLILEAAVTPDGTVAAFTGYVRSNYTGAAAARHPLALALFGAAFLAAALTRPLRSRSNLDVVVLAAAVAGAVLTEEGRLDAGLTLSFAAAIWLGMRCLGVGFRGRGEDAAAAPLLAARTAAALAVVAAVAVAVIALTGDAVTDIGFASVAGATTLLDGDLPYGAVDSPVLHGDTYPLLTYLAYVPGALAYPVRAATDVGTGALWVATLAALGTAALMWRLRGPRAALAWIAFPLVVVATSGGVNDIVVALCFAAALRWAPHPWLGALSAGAAAWVKAVPAVVVPVWIAAARGGWRRALTAVAALSAVLLVVAVALGGWSGPVDMVDAIGFQEDRRSLRSPWVLYGVPGLQPMWQALVVTLAVAATFHAGRAAGALGLPALAGLTGGLLLVAQLAGNRWSFSYLLWALPCVFVALLPRAADTRRA